MSVLHGNYRVPEDSFVAADSIPEGACGAYDPVLLAAALLRAGWTPPETTASGKEQA